MFGFCGWVGWGRANVTSIHAGQSPPDARDLLLLRGKKPGLRWLMMWTEGDGKRSRDRQKPDLSVRVAAWEAGSGGRE